MKSFLKITGVLSLLVLFLPASSYAEIYYGLCGENLQWKLDTESGLLEIFNIRPGTYSKMLEYDHAPWYSYKTSIRSVNLSGINNICNYAFQDCSSLTSITIPESVTNIGSSAFSGCSSLTSITIPESITSIGENTFFGCSSLSSITIPESVINIGNSAFYGCSSLTSITIPESVTNIGSKAFSDCSGLTSITIHASVTNIVNSTFANCSSLTSITIPKSVTNIGSKAFSGCSGLTTITIPESVTSIGSSAFAGCSGLTSVSIHNRVNSIGDEAFKNCRGLTSVELNSNAIISATYSYTNNLGTIFGRQVKEYKIGDNISAIGDYAFYNCSGLTSVTIPKGLTKIGDNAFKNCSSVDKLIYDEGTTKVLRTGLTSIISVTIPNSVTSINNSAFADCRSLSSITLPERLTSINQATFYNCSSLTHVAIPNSVTNIGSSAFSGCSSLTSITIPESVTNIGNSAFYGCSSLTSIDIPESVTYIGGGAFSGCNGLTTITIPKTILAIGDNTFSGCSSLTSINIPESVTSIGNNAFYGCSSLTSVTIPQNVLSIGSQTFSGCSSLTSVELNSDAITSATYSSTNNFGTIFGDQVREYKIGENITEISNYAFYNCNSLTSINIPESVTSIGNSTFFGCSGLSSIAIPNSVTSIGSYAFFDCSGLTSVNIPNSITSIGDGAFRNCSGLSTITIPNSVTSIGAHAFYGCSGLSSVTIPESVITIGNSAFSGCGGLEKIIVHLGNPNYDSRDNCNAIIETSVNNLICGCKTTNIPNNVISIGSGAFSSCSGLTSVTIPNSVTSIGRDAFAYCNGLSSITIPNSVTSIGENTFFGCSSLSSIIMSNSVISIGSGAFYGCSGLSTIIIPNSVLSIDNYTFSGCSSLASITIPESVTTIGSLAFKGCVGLTSVSLNSNAITSPTYSRVNNIGTLFGPQVKEYIIGDKITCIGDYAFSSCSGLTSVTISGSVESIGDYAFSGCSRLVSVKMKNENPVSIKTETFTNRQNATLYVPAGSKSTYASASYWKDFKEIIEYKPENDGIYYSLDKYNLTAQVTSVPNNGKYIGRIAVPSEVTIEGKKYSVMGIEAKAFYECAELSDISMPNSITTIGGYAFTGCTGISHIDMPENVSNIGEKAFDNCTGLISVKIGKNVTNVGNNAFSNCSAITTVNLDCETIGNWFAYNTKLQTLTLGEHVKSIGSQAFSGCTSLTSVTIPANLISIDKTAFQNCANIKLNAIRGTDGLISVWNYGADPYEKGASQFLVRPSISVVSTTQTSIKYQVNNVYPELEYQYDNNSTPLGSNEYLITGLRPELSQPINLVVKSANNSYCANYNAQTSPISPTLACEDVTASSLSVKGSYTKGDAKVVSCTLIMNGKEMSPEEGTLYGLDPNKSYSCKYSVVVEYGNGESYTYNDNESFYTSRLNFVTQQPRVISAGNVIVAADTNLNEEESNVGFEWRRTDWTDDFESKSGGAYQYGGRMEGYIRNLNTDKLWKYRAYYESDTGKRYYGEWKGIDPTDTSYFDPTVYTYARFSVKDNTAEVKGYAMRGTEDVKMQGFMYWKKGSSSTRGNAKSIPANAMVVEAKGNVMIATLENLDYDTEYCYVAFATTANNETFYGEEQTFKTGAASQDVIDGIESTEDAEGVTEVARYDLNGRKIANPQKGINIIRYSDGTSKKVLIK